MNRRHATLLDSVLIANVVVVAWLAVGASVCALIPRSAPVGVHEAIFA